jgi:hypothetical protein
MRRALLASLASFLTIVGGCHAHSAGMVLGGAAQWVGQNQAADRNGYGTPDHARNRYWVNGPP